MADVYKITVTKNKKRVFSAEYEHCDIVENRIVVPIYEKGKDKVKYLAPSSKINLTIKAHQHIEIDEKFYTNI